MDRLTLALAGAASILLAFVVSQPATALPYPDSDIISGVQFNSASHDERAPGSDNWPITWADDGSQYTSWGDGGGFGGTNSDGRVSLGVARVDGPSPGYTGHNIWGGKNPDVTATFGGKSYGIISIDGTLYMWVAPGSGAQNFSQQTLYYSTNHARSWTSAGWSFNQSDDVVLPTFAQFGQDYAGARDNYVYIYAIRLKNASDLQIQIPGQIDLFRVDKSRILERNAYEFFAGLDGNHNPTWTSDLASRGPVFQDAAGVGWNVSVSYNPGIGRYLLCTEHTTSRRGNLGIFDAPEPWGPWTTVGYYSNWENYGSTFFWNFSNKWLSADGLDFTLVFTGTNEVGENDSWNTIRGTFTLANVVLPPSGLTATAVSQSQIDLSWTDHSDNEDGFAVERREGGNQPGPPTVTLQNYAGANPLPSVETAGTANSFKTGALVVNDRADTWTAVPAMLLNQARLLTARDDRMNSPVSGMYTLDVSGPGVVYLPLDPRYGGSKLSWMDASWTDSTMTCSSSARSGWKIWKKEIAGPGPLVLGVDEQQYDGVTYVFTGPEGPPWTAIATVAANQTDYSDTGLAASTTYFYRVRAILGALSSVWSNEASATTSGGDAGTDAGHDAGADLEDGGRDSGSDSGTDGGGGPGSGCGCGTEAAPAPWSGLTLLLVLFLLRRSKEE